MTAVYGKMGLQFQYPENWKLAEPADSELPYQISLETPNGGLWSISLFPPEHASQEIISQAQDGISSQYPEAEFEPITNEFERTPESDEPAIEASFFCLDFLVTSHNYVVATPRYKMLIWFQAESREFEQMKNVFRAIAISMLDSSDLGQLTES